MLRTFRPLSILVFLLCACAGANAQTTINSITPNPICAGNTLSVEFSAALPLVGFDTLQLIDAGGTVTTIGTAVSVTLNPPSTIMATVPVGFSGNYRVVVKGTGVAGGSAASTDSLTVNAKPSVMASSTTVCSGLPASVVLTASTAGPSTFIWTPTAQTGASGATSQAIAGPGTITDVLTTNNHSAPGTVTYGVTAISAAGCSSAVTPVVVNVNPDPVVLTTSPALPICSGSSVNLVLTASTDGINTFTWTPTQSNVSGASTQATFVPGPISDIITTTTHTTAGSVSYLVTPKSDLGCLGASSATITVTVNPDPVVSSAAPASPICSGTALNVPLTASTDAASTFTWVSTPSGASTSDPADQATYVAGPINDIISATSNSTAGTINYVVTPKSAAGCIGAPTAFNVTVNPAPIVTAAAPTTPICSGETVTIPLTASTGAGATFTWVPTQTGVTGATTQSPTFAPGPISSAITNTSNSTQGTLSYLVTPMSASGCVGTPTTFNVAANPSPSVSTLFPTVTCSGVALNIPLTATTGAGAAFTWVATQQPGITGASNSLGFASGPITDVLTNASNTTAASVSYLVTPRSAQNCVGTSSTFNISVNPAPVLTSPAPASSICSGAPLTIPLSATTPGTSTFSWAATQTGVTGATQSTFVAAASFSNTLTATSNSTAGTVVYLITPRSAAGCTGAGVSFPIAVNPAPTVTTTAPAALCSGNTLTLPLTASTIGGVNTFTWTNTPTLVTGATSQAGPFATGPISDVLVNTTNNTQGSVTYNVTARSSLGCSGPTLPILVIVNPAPAVTATAPSAAVCSGVPFKLPLTASTSGASTFTWIPTQNGASGATAQFPLFGSDTISNTLFTTSLLHNVSGNVSYSVTPRSAVGCIGLPTALLVNVNPDPIVNSTPLSLTACSGVPFTLSPLTASTGPGSTFRWSVAFSNILPISGSPAFVSGPITNTLTTSNPLVQGTATYRITAKSPAGCVALDSTNYNVQVLPLPRLINRLDSVCSGTLYNTPFTSTAFPTGTYNWSIIGSNPNLTIGGATSNPNSPGPSNTFTYSNPAYGLSDTVRYAVSITTTGGANGCVGLDTFRLRVRPRPVITNVNPAPICSGLPVSILLKSSVVDSNNVTFNWSYSGNNTSNNGAQTLCFGCSAIGQTLNATSNVQGTAVYNVTGFYFGCASTAPAPITVTVNPRPRVTGIQPPTSVCSGAFTNINLNSPVASNFSWTTATILGSAQITGNNSGPVIIDTLKNLSNTATAQVQFTVTPVSQGAGCTGFDTSFFITINPTPVFLPSNSVLCSGDSTTINLLNATSTGGTGTWQWAFTPGPNASGGSGVSSFVPTSVIRQRLVNSSNSTQTFAVYSIRAKSVAGCESALVNDTVFINPLPSFTSNRDTSICSDSLLVYNVKASTGPSTKYSWLKVGSFGSPGNPFNFQFLNVPLVDMLNTGGVLSTRNVAYNIVLRSSENCLSDTTVLTRPRLNVTINPTPDTVGVSVSPAKICEGAEMLNFSARRTPVAPERFSWGVSNGSIYHFGGENALVSFPVPGTHTVFVTSNVPGFSCRSKPQPRTVSVDPGAVRKPNVVQFGNSLVCLTGATGGTITGYQWGYDLKQNLDSVLLPGETFQSYVFTTLDTTNKAYWVMATYAEGGCSYKAYFNRFAPLGVSNLSSTTTLPITVYPNPANAQLNVEFSRISAKVQLEVIDLTGRRAMQVASVSGNAQLDISALSPGCYFLNCYQDGQRVASARFIKN